MPSHLIKVLLGLSLLLNCFVLAGFVYRSWVAPPAFEAQPPPPPRPPPGMRPSPLEIIIRDLALDDGQREALGGKMDRYVAARRDRYREIQKVREQLAAELRQPQIDVTRIDGLVDQVARLRGDQWKESLHTAAEFEPALRPEQRERLHAFLAERYGGAPPPRPPGTPGASAAPGGRPPGPGRAPQ
jgi:Spy/CpxP family protein refolding chaperone